MGVALDGFNSAVGVILDALPRTVMVAGADPCALDYLASRGIRDATIIECAQPRCDGKRVWLPWFDEDSQKIYESGRSLNGAEPKWRNVRGEKPALFASCGAWQAPHVVVVEGQFDALVVAQAGRAAFATTSAGIKDAAFPILRGKQSVVLVPDADERKHPEEPAPGERWLSRMLAELASWTKISIAKLPSGVKDIADVAAAADDPIAAVRAILEAAEPYEPVREPAEAPRVEIIDINRLSERAAADDGISWLARGWIAEGTIVALAGEEGDGKTLFAEQTCRELLLGRPVAGYFQTGRPVGRILFVDTEMGSIESARRSLDLDRRGLTVPDGRLFYADCSDGLDLAGNADDRERLDEAIRAATPDLLWIDSGGNAVRDPKDDVEVKALFNYLARCGVSAIGLTLHPRKRAQGEHGRRFDDLFGSREWKGRLHKALYLEDGRVVAWKDRGGHLRAAWPPSAGVRSPHAILERPGLSDDHAAPFQVRFEKGLDDAPADSSAIEARLLEVLGAKPGELTKSHLADTLGGRRKDSLRVVNRLLAAGRIGPNAPRARLSVVDDQSLWSAE